MKLRFTNDWKNYYACHCKHCLWTGSSQDVQGDGDGPFYCPYCLRPDPTDSDVCVGPYAYITGNVIYYALRVVSLITQPIRLLYKKRVVYKNVRWWIQSQWMDRLKPLQPPERAKENTR